MKIYKSKKLWYIEANEGYDLIYEYPDGAKGFAYKRLFDVHLIKYIFPDYWRSFSQEVGCKYKNYDDKIQLNNIFNKYYEKQLLINNLLGKPMRIREEKDEN